MSPCIDCVVQDSRVAVCTVRIIRSRSPPQRIIVISILIIVRILAERRIQRIEHRSLVRRRAGKMVVVRQRRYHVPRLPVANAVEIRCRRVQLRYDLVGSGFGDGDVFGLGFVVAEFLSAMLVLASMRENERAYLPSS